MPGNLINLQAELSETEVRELDQFLAKTDGTMSFPELDGFLHAVISSPKPSAPDVWLGELGDDGDGLPFESEQQAKRILGLIVRWYNRIAGNLAMAKSLPVFLKETPSHFLSAASPWCIGYVHGIALHEKSWRQLLRADAGRLMLSPMFGLAFPPDDDEVRDLDASELQRMADDIPTAAPLIYQYWRMPPSVRRQMLDRVRMPAALRRRQPAADDSVHRLKIALRDVKPQVWRRIEVSSATKLPTLSRILLAAMGWSDTHLHEFIADGVHYGTDDPDFPSGVRSERNRTLSDIAPLKGDRFDFHYDFGDDWRHRVTVEAVTPLEGDATAPHCIAGARACPPEDCGGPGGYDDLLAALADPSHDEHESLTTWVGGSFDPTEFDLRSVNAHLAYFAPRRKRSAPGGKKS